MPGEQVADAAPRDARTASAAQQVRRRAVLVEGVDRVPVRLRHPADRGERGVDQQEQSASVASRGAALVGFALAIGEADVAPTHPVRGEESGEAELGEVGVRDAVREPSGPPTLGFSATQLTSNSC
jgi:hypothetical protein